MNYRIYLVIEYSFRICIIIIHQLIKFGNLNHAPQILYFMMPDFLPRPRGLARITE